MIRWTIPWWRQRPLNKRPDDLDPAPRRSWDIGRTLASGRPNLDVVRHSVTKNLTLAKKTKKKVSYPTAIQKSWLGVLVIETDRRVG